MVLLALFGAVMGQGVIWYTGQFYAQNFLETKCNIEFEQSRTIMLWAIAFATPFFLLFGWLSDKIGRKWIMMAGMLLGIITYRPIFNIFLKDTNIEDWQKNNNIQSSDPILSNEQIAGNENKFIEKISKSYALGDGRSFIAESRDTFEYAIGTEKSKFIRKIGSSNIPPYYLPGNELEITGPIKTFELNQKNISYKDKHLSSAIYWKFIGLVFLLILYVTMVYGPIAAFLVEMFPTKIRYTSMSLPYHIGNGVFGGLVPFIGLLLTTTYPKDPLVGLWYPISIAGLCLIIGTIYLRNKIDEDVTD